MIGPLQTTPTPLFFVPDGGAWNIDGLVQSSYGLVALTPLDTLVASVDNGSTFSATPTDLPSTAGGGNLTWLGEEGTHLWTAVTDDGNVCTTHMSPPWSGNPWGTCVALPDWLSSQVPPPQQFYRSPAGGLMVSLESSQTPPQVEVSFDGGFTSVTLGNPNLPDGGTYYYSPNVLGFYDGLNGIVASGNGSSSSIPFAYVTSDGARTWTDVQLPPSSSSAEPTLTSVFYAPGGLDVWILGWGSGANPLVLYMSSNGGRPNADGSTSFVDLSGNAASNAPSGINFVSGFALDATHIWLGGSSGMLFFSNTGGQ
jgi:hypothetical protein